MDGYHSLKTEFDYSSIFEKAVTVPVAISNSYFIIKRPHECLKYYFIKKI